MWRLESLRRCFFEHYSDYFRYVRQGKFEEKLKISFCEISLKVERGVVDSLCAIYSDAHRIHNRQYKWFEKVIYFQCWDGKWIWFSIIFEHAQHLMWDEGSKNFFVTRKSVNLLQMHSKNELQWISKVRGIFMDSVG